MRLRHRVDFSCHASVVSGSFVRCRLCQRARALLPSFLCCNHTTHPGQGKHMHSVSCHQRTPGARATAAKRDAAPATAVNVGHSTARQFSRRCCLQQSKDQMPSYTLYSIACRHSRTQASAAGRAAAPRLALLHPSHGQARGHVS